MQLLQQGGEKQVEGEANNLESPEASKNQEVFNFNEP